MLEKLETQAVDFVARFAPWLAPLPTAYLTATATVEHLAWPKLVGIIAGAIVEALGLAGVSTALELREYNATRRKIPDDWEPTDKNGRRKTYRGIVDPPAPFKLAVITAAVYFGSVTFLTVALDTAPQLATYAPLVFPVMSLAGATILAMRADHKRRLEAIVEGEIEREANRSSRRPRTVQSGVQEPSPVVRPGVQKIAQNDALDAINVSRREHKAAILDTMLDVYLDSPETGPTEIARRLGIGRSTVYNYLDDLEAAGRISRGNGRIEVLGVS